MPILLPELLERVDVAFGARDPRLALWPDPHPDGPPADDEYSRVTIPGRWGIVGARADAWVSALVDRGLASAEPVDPERIAWSGHPGTLMTSAVAVRPVSHLALPLIVARNRVGTAPDAGVTLGLGAPALCVGWFPQCGCDACDSGAADDIENLDRYLTAIVTGRYRRLSKRRRVIVVVGEEYLSWSGGSTAEEVRAVLDHPSGWRELSGGSWLA